MDESILVINPNSSQDVTSAIDSACAPLRFQGGPPIECTTLEEGPPGIETQRDVDSVVAPLVRLISSREKQHSAFVIACFSDPALHSAREITRKPVLGIAECGILTALTLGQRVGVMAILKASVARHLRYIAALGVAGRLAAELPVGLGVAELRDEHQTLQRMLRVGKSLCDDHGADVIVMGCAGMAPYRERLQDALGTPVVEPTQAAVAMAVGRVRLAWHAGSDS
jgi:Asp/Glu/hydantoin racemase